ncbi:hypothetical protein [Aphanothece sacrum]|uniref:3-oxoacyl-ACP synthase n=1 Tax=Aphanothece sacrum FPU1 TaxID=1920663 RepID=A0A401IJY9_APHSA|nr:hypothetical protein [Aphanothece sacrum]GBF81613.1 3-oxoacyl-ACP synthase [Aphanothece sacrum FPU1]GBF84129.1 3-oxoacyl-ACP synthase [Aphanothece sacrum FPU3]
MTTVHKNLDKIPSMSAKRAKELETMSDEDIDYSDIPPLDEAFFQKVKRVERKLTNPEKI